MTSGEGRFRGDIEGLRAVAVVLVVLYHAGLRLFGGGYVGVDVFFVVSGFLITGLLWRELEEHGRISFAEFYRRRIRRLLPLSTLVLVGTVAASAAALSPLRARDVMRDGVAAAVYGANYRFAAVRTEYFTSDSPPSPLLHYWSLAVEEQFYFVWPLLLWAAFRAGRGRGQRRGVVLGALAVLGAVSLAASVVVTATSQPWAFFSLPTRAWELAVGAALALTVATVSRMPKGVAAALGWAGMLAVLAAAVTYDEATAFPGVAALAPVLGTAALVAAGAAAPRRGVSLLLGAAPLRRVGRWSYAWYLWHWPVLALAPAVAGRTLSTTENVALGLASLAPAVATHYLVENPVRFAPRPPGLRVGAALTAVAVAVPLVVATGLAPLQGGGASVEASPAVEAETDVADPDEPLHQALREGLDTGEVPSNLTPTIEGARRDRSPIYAAGCHRDFLQTSVAGCEFGVRTSDTTMFLFGDSHAAQWFPALERVAVERGWRLVSLTKSTCPALDVRVFQPVLKRPYRECDAWRDKAVERMRAEGADIVVLGMARHYDAANRVDVFSAEWNAGLGRMVERVRATGAKPVVFSASPRPGIDVPDCLSRHLEDVRACTVDRAAAFNGPGAQSEAAAVTGAGGMFLDVAGWACAPDRCPAVVGNLLVYRDDNHLTAAFAAWLAPVVGRALPDP